MIRKKGYWITFSREKKLLIKIGCIEVGLPQTVTATWHDDWDHRGSVRASGKRSNKESHQFPLHQSSATDKYCLYCNRDIGAGEAENLRVGLMLPIFFNYAAISTSVVTFAVDL